MNTGSRMMSIVASLATLIFLNITISQTKSLTRVPGLEQSSDDPEVQDDLLKRLRSHHPLSRDRSDVTWTPNDVSRDDWMDYHGMSRDQWTHVLRTLEAVDHIEKGDIMRDLDAEPSDRIAEGCFWYTEEQANEALQTAIARSKTSSDVIARGNDVTDAVLADSSDIDKDSGSGEEETLDAKEEVHHRQKRKIESFSKNPERKWSNPILFKFDGSHTEEQRDVIKRAFSHWEQRTCVRFFEINVNADIEKAHLLLTSEGYGCYSFVGKTTTVPQQLNLAPICLTQFGVPVHEIGHALGLWHEHQRADRDLWVRIVKENIAYYSSQFYKRSTVSHGVPYDFGSVMHYGGTAGSRGRKYTLEPIDPMYKLSMGQRAELSYLDAKIINLEYCQGECRNTLPVECQRGGYQNPNDCDSCICPDGFGGRYCQDVAQPTRAECGGSIELGDARTIQTIQTPGFESPGYYDDYTECNWLIKAPKGYKIQLSFEEDSFGVYCQNSQTCFHWVEIKHKTDFEYPGPRFCCYDNPDPLNVTSEGNEMAIIFRSNFPTKYQTVRRGFRASLIAIPPEGSSEQVPFTSSPEVDVEQPVTEVTSTTTQPAGTEWGEWSGSCTGHQCQCGGCSSKARLRMCGKQVCQGELAARETKICDRACVKKDKFIQYTGAFIRSSCPICCPGYNIDKTGKCVPNEE